MATYTPAQLIAPKLMGNGAANIATWRSRDTSNLNVHRTATFASAAARAVTVEVGAVAADTAAQKIMDAEVLTVNVTLVKNWWIVTAVNDYFEGFASAADVVAASYGYSYA